MTIKDLPQVRQIIIKARKSSGVLAPSEVMLLVQVADDYLETCARGAIADNLVKMYKTFNVSEDYLKSIGQR